MHYRAYVYIRILPSSSHVAVRRARAHGQAVLLGSGLNTAPASTAQLPWPLIWMAPTPPPPPPPPWEPGDPEADAAPAAEPAPPGPPWAEPVVPPSAGTALATLP